jgi:hypothetical protein
MRWHVLKGSSLSRGKEIMEYDVIYEIFMAKFLILQNSPHYQPKLY